MDVIAESTARVYQNRDKIKGLKMIYPTEVFEVF